MPPSSNFGCCFDIWLNYDNTTNKLEEALIQLGLDLKGGLSHKMVNVSIEDDRMIECMS
jgi:hypothetical protein